MFRPSTAPRWKMAISSLRRVLAAAAARPRNDGANPSDSIAIAPDFRKTLRFMRPSFAVSMALELRRPDPECKFSGAGHVGRQCDARHVAGRESRREVHARDE